MDVWHISHWELGGRLLCAVTMGGIIGWEREYSNHSAGLRTHILVCVGSALIMLLSMYGFSQYADQANVRMDPARLAAQVISGIGFLGAGTILRNGMAISGLTTAASLWVVAAIGLSVGAGFYLPSAVVTLIVFACLFILNGVEKRVFRTRKNRQLSVTAAWDPGVLERLNRTLDECGATVRRVSLTDRSDRENLQIVYMLSGKKSGWLEGALQSLSECEGVQSVNLHGYDEGAAGKGRLSARKSKGKKGLDKEKLDA